MGNVEAGARAIFRRALAVLGINPPREIQTGELVKMAVEWDAPVIHQSRRWLLFAYGVKRTKEQAELMKAQSVYARLLWTREKARKRRGKYHGRARLPETKE